jgi:hypothetical protein
LYTFFFALIGISFATSKFSDTLVLINKLERRPENAGGLSQIAG